MVKPLRLSPFGIPGNHFETIDPAVSSSEIISHEPATGAVLWRGEVGDVDETVMRARRAWPQWAAQPLATRI